MPHEIQILLPFGQALFNYFKRLICLAVLRDFGRGTAALPVWVKENGNLAGEMAQCLKTLVKLVAQV